VCRSEKTTAWCKGGEGLAEDVAVGSDIGVRRREDSIFNSRGPFRRRLGNCSGDPFRRLRSGGTWGPPAPAEHGATAALQDASFSGDAPPNSLPRPSRAAPSPCIPEKLPGDAPATPQLIPFGALPDQMLPCLPRAFASSSRAAIHKMNRYGGMRVLWDLVGG
jgi:hypothetical protein